MEEEKKQKTEHGHNHEHSHEDNHAKIVGIGTVTLGGTTFMIDRDGQVEAGKKTEFGVELVGEGTAVPKAAWLANPDGTKVCDPVSGEGHEKHWHFNVEPLDPVKKSKFVLQVGEEEATIDFCRLAEPINGGILAVFKGADTPAKTMFLELKLHGDAGDLELWLYESFPKTEWAGVGGKPRPFDVSPDTVITLAFPSHPGKSVTLSVRDADKNEDEEGKPNMRPGGTNYFIFPGESGQDPAWLVGETVTSWRGVVTATFEAGGKSFAGDPFVLVPHDAL